MKSVKSIFSLLIFLFGITLSIQAQTTVTFNVNLQPMLEDSSFMPGQDVIQLVGNLPPLGSNRPMQMKDEAPIDSIYTIEIRFPARYNNQELLYNFKIVTPEEEKTESMPRKFRLTGREANLPALYFDAFAW